jgi:hypothetical protein
MTEVILLDDKDYSTLRRESREALHKLGIPSNPGFTNHNIISGLANALGLPSDFPEEGDISEYSGAIFRDSLGELLGLEIPPPATIDIVRSLRNVDI